MAIICPTVTAYDNHEYREQMERITPFANRVHIDLMDGMFAPTLSPALEQAWWPSQLTADVHLMYKKPMDSLRQIINLRPRLVIIHAEAEVDHMLFVAELHKEKILAGLAILQETEVESTFRMIHSFDHVLVFSGKLGYHGGEADLSLTDKVIKIREECPDAEIGWDGGVTDRSAGQLVQAGVDVLNAGGFIQKSANPQDAYDKLLSVIKA